ncbi:MAG TPA: MFS transporter [Bacteroidales bacterium]|nr:MFS transporter [Bacteroidales bacterium]HPT11762.1 MFS transporter [Bacteroidales bacterium]
MFNRRVVFFAACFGMLLFGISLITLGSIVPDIKLKLGIDNGSAGSLFAILPFGILAGSLLFGPVCDKWGYRLMLAISSLFICGGFVSMANVASLNLLRIVVFFFGAGAGAINGATNAIVSDLSSKDKGANLSLLGVCFTIGALGMPLVLGLLRNVFSFEKILIAVALLTALTAVFYLLINFPPPKHTEGISMKEVKALLSDKMLLLISFFLFFQSSFESLINNWTTTFLISELNIEQSKALFALSASVVGMAVMRLLIGSVFRKVSPERLLSALFIVTMVATIAFKMISGFYFAAVTLFLAGAGLAGGFPVMLGFVGERFSKLSATAFSIAFAVALTGNILVNYLMGQISKASGIGHLTTVIIIEFVALVMIGLLVFRKRKRHPEGSPGIN